MNTVINEMNKLSLCNTTNNVKYNDLFVYPLQTASLITSFLVIDGDAKSVVRTNNIYEYWCISCRSDHSSHYCKHEIAVGEFIYTKLGESSD